MDEQNDARARHGNFEHVSVLLAHLRLRWLLQHFPPRLVWAVYVCVNSFITIGLLALLALVTGSPFIFPSLVQRRICSFSPHWPKLPVRAMLFWDMRLDSSAAMLLLRLR
jgi:hypothetical protein